MRLFRPLKLNSLHPISRPLPFLELHDFIHYLITRPGKFIIAIQEAKCFVMMQINVCVVCLDKKMLLKWTIIILQESEYSFVDFFTICIIPRLPSTSQMSEDSYTLERAEVGLSKDKLDYVDISLKVVEVTESFGKFVKLFVELQKSSKMLK